MRISGKGHLGGSSVFRTRRARFYFPGELAQTLDFMDPQDGKVEWNVTNSAGEPLASDVYLYIVESGGNKKTGKLMVIR